MRLGPPPSSLLRVAGKIAIACVLLLPQTALGAGRQSPAPAAPAEESGWRISPDKINLLVGEPRTLQILDDSARELGGAAWSIDDEARAELRDDDHWRIVVVPRAPGTVRVTALIAGERRERDITIWPPDRMPKGTTRWGVHPIGREFGDIPAVPVDGAPNMYSLEQTAAGVTFLRAGREDGIQICTGECPWTGATSSSCAVTGLAVR